MTGFESERPTLYSIEEVAEATNDFDETRIIGVGGYGSVYFGVIGEKVRTLLIIYVLSRVVKIRRTYC